MRNGITFLLVSGIILIIAFGNLFRIPPSLARNSAAFCHFLSLSLSLFLSLAPLALVDTTTLRQMGSMMIFE